jgi:hypothetical protein
VQVKTSVPSEQRLTMWVDAAVNQIVRGVLRPDEEIPAVKRDPE